MKPRINVKGLIWRILFYFAGQFLCGCAVALSVNAGLGVLPGSSLAYACSLVTGIDLGICTFLIFTILLILQIILVGKAFRLLEVIQLAGAVVFSGFVSVGTRIFAFWQPTTYPGRVAELCAGLVFFVIGIAIYIDTDLLTNVPERTTLAMSKRFGVSVGVSKIILDCSMVLLAAIITWIGCGRIIGVREGTVIAALGVGALMNVMHKRIAPWVKKHCFGPVDKS